jgi:hypothetical protein
LVGHSEIEVVSYYFRIARHPPRIAKSLSDCWPANVE